MPISDITISKIKDAIDIVDVIGDYVELKKKGQNWWALSPFSNEKTPSFSVSPAKGIFKDFSSGKGGDAISFIMELEGLSYVEALKVLAKKYSIEIEEIDNKEEERLVSERESLLIVNSYAADFFKKHLEESEEGKTIGQTYLKERGILGHTIQEFELGLSPNSWDGLYKELKEKKYNLDFAEQSGLIIRKEDKTFDRFRGRLIFPIHNLSGKVIGFGGRVLKSERKDQPKYLNSPESPVYHKGQILYGLYQGRLSIRQEDECLLVEGYTDVLSFSQAGIKNVVASSGTALTPEQVKLIGRFSKNITIVYDGDAAGLSAAARGLEIILEEGLDPRIVVFPEGKDPDEFLRTEGFDETKKILKSKANFIDFLAGKLLESAGSDPIRRAAAIKEIVRTISKVPDPIKKNLYFKQCSEKFEISEDLLVQEHNKIRLSGRKSSSTSDLGLKEKPQDLNEQKKFVETNYLDLQAPREAEILKIMILFGNAQVDGSGSLASYLIENIKELEFSHEGHKSLIDYYRSIDSENGYPELEDFLNSKNLEPYKSLVIDLTSEKYDVSPNWEAHNIHVPTVEEVLGDKMSTDIYRLKWTKLKELINDNRLEIQKLQESDPEANHVEIMKLVRQQKDLKKKEKLIAEVLGNVISL